MTYTYADASDALPYLLKLVLEEGTVVKSRNGDTKEVSMVQVQLLNPSPAEITTHGRRVSLPAQIAETMWLLAGRNDIEWLSHYLPRAADFSDDGKTWRGGYGPRLRAWAEELDTGVDQLAHVVHLLKEDPTTRRAVLAIYDPTIDTTPGKDIPCNNWVHLLPRDGVLHAHVAIRSNDLFWGWSGINSFEWTSLLTIVAGLTGLRRGSITFSISSLHLYEQHWDRAEAIVQHASESLPPVFSQANPEFTWDPSRGVEEFDALVDRWFKIEALIRANNPGAVRAIQDFPEPLMQSWLYVLQAWNQGDLALAGHLQGSSLFHALATSPPRKVAAPVPVDLPEPSAPSINRAAFTVFATKLHAEKNAAYGDSWKKRGEMLGIMANIARKVDRLGVPGGGDTAADTAIDLMMYLIKYNLWLRQQSGAQDAPTTGQSHVDAVDFHLQYLESHSSDFSLLTNAGLIEVLRGRFDQLEHLVEEKRANRGEFVKDMIGGAYVLATRLWSTEQWQVGNATRSWNPEMEDAK